jgi:uncharacterized membrane protein
MSDNFEKYKGTLSAIYRRTKEELWTMQFATLILLLFAVLFLTIVVNVVFISFGNWFFSALIYIVELGIPLVMLYLHQREVYEAVRRKALEMDATHPGIYAAYEEWRGKVDSPSS